MVLALMLSALFVAVSATGSDDCEDAHCCAAESSTKVVCDHLYYLVHTGYFYTSNGKSNHTVQYANLLTCGKCGLQTLEVLEEWNEAHNIVDGVCQKCGYIA